MWHEYDTYFFRVGLKSAVYIIYIYADNIAINPFWE